MADIVNFGGPAGWAGVVVVAIGGGYALLRAIYSLQDKTINRVLDKVLSLQADKDREILETMRNHMSDDRRAFEQVNQHMGQTVEALRQLHEDIVLSRERKS